MTETPRLLASPATDAAATLLGELTRRGLRHIVLSPGSRSQSLALVAAALERRGDISLHVRIDERVAGFTALGLARETRMPVALVCTSGTAAANLLPAALEAHHSGVPLLLLTADRPPELRGVGANQTTRQLGMFSPSVRFEADVPVPEEADDEGDADATAMLRELAAHAFDAALGAGTRAAGPVHLNLPYREPLAGELPAWFDAEVRSGSDTAVTGAAPDAEPGGDEQRTDVEPGTGAEQWTDAEPGGDAQRTDDEPGTGAETGAGARADTDAETVSANVNDAETAAGAETELELGEEPASGALYQGGGGIGEADLPADPDDAPYVLVRGPRTVVIAGADAGPGAEALAFAGGWPLVAEIVSGSRFGRYAVRGYRSLLRDAHLGGRIERAVVWGHPTLSREVTALLSRTDLEVVALRGPGEPLNLNDVTTAADTVRVASGDADREWLGAWLRASAAASIDLDPPAPDAAGLSSNDAAERRAAVAAEVAAVRRPLDREGLVDSVWRATWPHDRLMFGSSRLVRIADDVLPGKKVPVHANRGLAGIDGTVATAMGIALASQAAGAPGVTRLLLGDLALLHDVGAFLLPPAEHEPRLQVIVGNDGGGTIFDGLEVSKIASHDDMNRVLYTPQSVRLEQIATAYGWEYQRVTTRAALDQALTSPVGGRQLIEVPLSR